jgi:4-amino-4-deoxy-L-arabinose transferase-like glycosyltransferase
MMKALALSWKTEKRMILILGAILAVSIFLRVYHFHDWLHFGSDQARDLELVEGVVDHGKSWPLLGADASNTHFKLGPAYHYFQIIAMMLFGDDPSVMAYPDVLFSLLVIPLFFAFLRKYFDEDLSLILVFLYAVSFFSVEFSRFAWNPNPLPFFVALFLLSMLRFLEDGERTAWMWSLSLGIALGIGIQLHTLLLLLLPIFSVLVLIASLTN